MTLTLLALPCAGASATMYMRWRKQLPQSVRLLPVELPGRGMRMGEAYVRDFAALADSLCCEHAGNMVGDYVLFGHSMGALLAYSMAVRQRRRQGRMPRALIVSASQAPSMRDPDRFAGMDDDEALIADLRRQGGTPDAVFASAELLRMTLDTLDADYRVCGSYVHAPEEAPLDLPLHVLAGRDDDIEAACLHAWRKEAAGKFTLDWFDGNHFFIWQQEANVLEHIGRLLRAVQAR